MESFKTRWKAIVLVFLFTFVTVLAVNASAKAGEASVFEGSTVSIALADAYKRTLRKATQVTYRWYSENDSYAMVTSSTRYDAVVKGVKATSACRVYFQCSYFIDGYFRTMDFYYVIKVKATNVNVTRVTLNSTSERMKEGDTFWLVASVYPTNATNKNVNWKSGNTSVATVSNSGLVTARAMGTTTITCHAADGSGVYATCKITVEASTVYVYPASISLDKTSASLKVGNTLQLKATVLPEDATDKTVTWRSDNVDVATVSTEGFVTAKGVGVANIVATTVNNVTAVCAITIEEEYVGTPSVWQGRYRVSSRCVSLNPSREYPSNFEMTIKDVKGIPYITSMFGDDLTQCNGGGFRICDNGDGTAFVDISNNNVLWFVDRDSPVYALYVLDEKANVWADTWTLRRNDDGAITLGDFYVLAFSWVEEDNMWRGRTEALYYGATAQIDDVSGIALMGKEMPDVRIGKGAILLDEETDMVVYKDNGIMVYSGRTRVVDNLPRGLYIVRIGRQSKKIFVK